MAPRGSIVIVGYGNRAVTETCLQSLDDALGDRLGDEYELVLVDNNSPDDTLELFESWSDRAHVVALPSNRNFAGGTNAGAAVATGDVLVFLNNDTEVPPGAIEALVEQALEPGVGLVGCRLLYPTGRIQHAGVVFRRVGDIALPLHLFHHAPGDLPAAGATYDLDATTGACFVMRRELFAELSGFEETYVNGLEDIDLAIRVRLAGHRVVYRGDVAILHHERITRGAKHDEHDNARVFVRRWAKVCDGDEEMLERMVGGRFGPVGDLVAHPQALANGTDLVFSGETVSLAPEAPEALALLALADAIGLDPALRDASEPFSGLEAALAPDRVALVARTRQHPARVGALSLHVPGGAWWGAEVPGGVVRAGAVPTRGLRDDHLVLAASPGARDAFVAAGLSAARVDVLAPPIEQPALGAGGDGVLALVPAHDPQATWTLLTALADCPADVTLLLNVVSAGIEALVAQRLSGARLLSPVTDESAFATLAGRHDVVLAAADADPFERHALVAAATGTATVCREYGVAATVLGAATAAPVEVDALRIALHRALDESDERSTRAARVAAACSPSVLAEPFAARLEAWGRIEPIGLAELGTARQPARV